MLLYVSQQLLLRQSSFTSKMFHLASLLSITLKAKSVTPFKKNYYPFCLIYVVLFTLSLFKCHCFIFNFRFDPNMNISKRSVNFQKTLKSELDVETLCSFFGSFFVLVKCQKVLLLFKISFLSSFQNSQMAILMIFHKVFKQTGGGVFLPQI